MKIRMLCINRSFDTPLNSPSYLTAANRRGARPLPAIRKSIAPSTMSVSSPRSPSHRTPATAAPTASTTTKA
jgi:hypothetical protein